MSPGNGETAPAANEDRFNTQTPHSRQATESEHQDTAGGDPYGDVPHTADMEEDGDPATLREQDIRSEVRKLEIRNEARARVTAASNAHVLDAITAPTRLDDFLAVDDEPCRYRIDQLFPIGGRVMLSAQYKAGKTTAVGNLIRSLVDGDPFLGQFDSEPVQHVTLIDNELDERTLRRWLRDQQITNQAAVQVLSLRGRVGAFNILDDDVRARWSEMLAGTDVLILDVLRPVLDALGLDENHDAGRLLIAFDALLAEAGITEGVIAHHMGHSGERSRGDSRLQDWPDALWKLVRQSDEPNSPRYFSAFGRDVDVAEGAVTYDVRTRNLTYSTGSRKDAVTAEAEGHITRWLATNPGASGREIEFALTADPGLTQKAIRDALKAAKASGVIHCAPGPKRSTLHYVTEIGSGRSAVA